MLSKLLERLKQSPEQLKRKVASQLPTLKHQSKQLVRAMLGLAIISTFVLKVPEIHSLFLRYQVGSRTYIITNAKGQGGGTGFAVEAPSGKTYILTNAHVCEALKARSGGSDELTVVQNDGKKLARKIIAISDHSDLCLVESLPGVTGISVGGMPYEGQKMYSIGHPGLKPRTISIGDVNGLSDITIPFAPISAVMKMSSQVVDSKVFTPAEGGISEENCSKPKNVIQVMKRAVMFMELEFKVCANITKKTYVTNMLSQPGASGSPVVDSLGRVIGVLFAGDEYSWAFVVNSDDIKQFLEMY